MTVAELIELLKAMPQDAEVFIVEDTDDYPLESPYVVEHQRRSKDHDKFEQFDVAIIRYEHTDFSR